MPHPQFHRLVVTDIRRETADCVSVTFAVPPDLRDAYAYTPGQDLTLRATIDGEEVRRSYSICSGLDDEELRVAIKRLDGGAFSGWVEDALRTGDDLDVMTPDGRFGIGIEPELERTLVALAAGSGITPIMAILKTVLHRERGHFVLFYGNRTSSGIIFREQLEMLKDRFMTRLSIFHVLSRERQDLPVLNGRLEAEKVRGLMRLIPEPAELAHAFICGPQPMIEGLGTVLLDLGFDRTRVHVERFTPGVGGRPKPPIVTPATAAIARATVIFEGIQAEFPVAADELIIDAGLRAGLNLPFSCHGGMCCTCRARLLEGQVEMAVNYSLELWEINAGYVLTCQSRPVTARVVIDYDAA